MWILVWMVLLSGAFTSVVWLYHGGTKALIVIGFLVIAFAVAGIPWLLTRGRWWLDIFRKYGGWA